MVAQLVFWSTCTRPDRAAVVPSLVTLVLPTVMQAMALAGRVVAGADFPITIEGHTDNIPINTVSFPSNWELSAVRASSVVRLFVGRGVAAARLTAAGYGDQRPLDNNDTADGRARNRRVTILIESMVPEVAPEAAPTVPVRGPVDGALGTPENARLVVPSASESLAP